MGSYNYLIIPDMRLKITTKIDTRSEYNTPHISNLDKIFYNSTNEYYNDDQSIEDTKVSDLTVKQISTMYNNTKLIDNVSNEFTPMEYFIVYYCEKKALDYFTISEHDTEELKKYKDYILLE
jgi:hypothetical protein